MKNTLLFSIAFVFSVLLGIVVPRFLNENISINDISDVSLIKQEVEGYSDTNVVNYKIYDSGKLIGTVKNIDKLMEDIKNYDFDIDYEYNKNTIGLTENIYIVEDYSKIIYKDIEQEIINYLASNNCIGIEAKCVIFSTDKGVHDKTYIIDESDFEKAKSQFILNFISQDTLNKIERGEIIESPLSFGSVETGVTIEDKIEIKKCIASPDLILKNDKEIYEYLCYGENKERQYYTTKEGDTLAGVGYYFNSMSARQVMMLNSDIIKDENQIIDVGTVLNVTYYTSPLTVTVTKERLSQEIKYPDSVVYVEDSSLPLGQTKVDIKEQNGLENVLYKETWVNGQLLNGEKKSSVEIKSTVQGRVLIGAGSIIPSVSAGSGNWRWPVQNPIITCNYYCYANHGGVDFQNLYSRWDYVYAIDSGTVQSKGWTDAGGYYVRIDHNNGYVTYYGHFSAMPFVEEGQTVSAGEVLGPIGMTGIATGPHVHLAMYENGVMIDPCTVLNCSLLY